MLSSLTTKLIQIVLNTINKLLAPPVFEGDAEKTRQADLLNPVICINLLIAALIIVAVAMGKNVPTRSLIIAIFWLLTLALGWRILHRGAVTFTALALSILLFVFLTGASISLGTIRTPATAVYVFWVIMVGMLFKLRGIVIATSASSLAILGLILAENAGLLPRPDYSVGITQWLTYTTLFGMTASLVYHGNRMTQRTLARAESELEQRKQTELQMHKLSRAVEQSPASIVITDLAGTIEYVNPRFSKVSGYSFDEAVGQNPRILKSEKTLAEVHRQMWAALSGGNEWHGEFINRKKDGSLFDELAVISPITDRNGAVTHYLAVKEDITERKRFEESLRISEMRHRLMAESASDVIWTMAPDGTITYVSPAVEAVRGFTPAEAMRQTLDEIHPPASKAISLGYFTKLLADVAAGAPTESFKGELEFFCKDGSTIWTQVIAHPLFSDQGLVEILGVTRDISEHKRLLLELQQAKDATETANQALQIANAELTRIATTDPLTGVWNRRHFEQLAATERAQARRYKQPLSMLLFDIDHFKLINDRYGHQTGDRVLIELTQVVAKALRDTDVLARWGGEEFVVIMSHCAEPDAMQLAEKLRIVVAAHPFAQVGTVTISLGAAEFNSNETVDDWFSRIDQALYAAKAAGRNTVRLG